MLRKAPFGIGEILARLGPASVMKIGYRSVSLDLQIILFLRDIPSDRLTRPLADSPFQPP